MIWLYLSVFLASLRFVESKNKIHICLTGNKVFSNTVNSVFNLLESPNPDYVLFPEVRSSSSLPHLRSAVLTEWYNTSTNKDLFVFIDNDQTFTVSDFNQLISCKVDVCGGLYRIHAGGNSNFPNCLFGQSGLRGFIVDNNKEVEAIGTGFMVIKRPILTKIIQYLEENRGYSFVDAYNQRSVPFFHHTKIKINHDRPREWLGEDHSFCNLVRKAGGKINAFYSPTIGHDKLEVLYVNEYYRPQSLTTN